MNKLSPWQKALLIAGSLGLLWFGHGLAVEAMKPVVPEGQPCAGGKLVEGAVVGSNGFNNVTFEWPLYLNILGLELRASMTGVDPSLVDDYKVVARDEWLVGGQGGVGVSMEGQLSGKKWFRWQGRMVWDKPGERYCLNGTKAYRK